MKFKSKKIYVGIIGLGRISEQHISCIKKNKNFTLESVCDLDQKKNIKFSKKYNVKSYKDYRDMLKFHVNLNLIVIATPSGMHYEHSIEIIKNFKKNLIIEKPLTLKISQAKKIFNLAKKNNVTVFPVFQNRYNSAVQRIKKSILKKELGTVRVVNVRVRWCRPQRYYDLSKWRGTFSHDGGALTNQGIHHIDLLRYLFGEIKFVNCQMRTFGSNIEVEDTVVSTFEFESGSIGTLEITTAARPRDFEASISIIGSKGIAQIGGIAVNNLEIFTPNPKDEKKFSENFKLNYYGFGHFKLYDSIKNYFFNGKKYLITYKDCLFTLRLLHCFYNSAHKDKKIYFKYSRDFLRLGEKKESLSKLYRYGKK